MDDKIIKNNTSYFNLGDTVAFRTHPYIENHYDIKISAYSHFTPPIMIIVEISNVKDNNVEHQKKKNSFKCLYYSTEKGSFEEGWFNETELHLIKNTTTEEKLVDYTDLTSLENLKSFWIGRKVVLKTVDLELNKIKIYRDSNILTKEKQNYFLDFLPPLATVVDLKESSDYKGANVVRSRLAFKIKWYNNKKCRFSESEISEVALRDVTDLSNIDANIEDIDSEDIFLLIDQEINLAGSNDIVLKNRPVRFLDVLFRHYRYIYRYKCCFSNAVYESESSLSKIVDKEILDTLTSAPNTTLEKNDRLKSTYWYKITYLDMRGSYTNRIVFVVNKENGTAKNNLIIANCLLRNGAIRHFNRERILSYSEIPDKILEEFKSDTVLEVI